MDDKYLAGLIRDLSNARKRGDDRAQIFYLFQLSNYYYKNQNYDKANIILEQIGEFNPNLEELNYFHGLIELQRNNLKKASSYFKKELKINPDNKDTKIMLDKLEINSNLPFVTIFLFLMNLLVFYFIFPQISLVQLIRYSLSFITGIDVFTIITSIFFHANIYHFLVNMFVLIMFGFVLEKHIGSLRFVFIYLFSGIVGNTLQALLYPESFVLGASGALFGIIGALLMRQPLLTMRIFGIVKCPLIILFGAFFAISSFIERLIISGEYVSGEIAHLFGFLTGILIAAFMFRDRIIVFYNWLAIFFGFFLLRYVFETFLFMASFVLIDFARIVALFFAGIIMIIYSYIRLRQHISLRGDF